MTVYLVPSDPIYPVTLPVTIVVPPTAVPGQNARVTFTGTSDQVVSFSGQSVTGDTGVIVDIYLTNPDGTQNGGGHGLAAGQSWSSGPRTLPANGTYAIWANPRYELRGGVTLTVTSP